MTKKIRLFLGIAAIGAFVGYSLYKSKREFDISEPDDDSVLEAENCLAHCTSERPKEELTPETSMPETDVRYTVIETSDAFKEPYAVWDNKVNDYYITDDGTVPTFASQEEADTYIENMSMASKKEDAGMNAEIRQEETDKGPTPETDTVENDNTLSEDVGSSDSDTNCDSKNVLEQHDSSEIEKNEDDSIEKPLVEETIPDDFNKQECILSIVSKSDVYTKSELEEMSDEDLFTLLRFIYDTDNEKEND